MRRASHDRGHGHQCAREVGQGVAQGRVISMARRRSEEGSEHARDLCRGRMSRIMMIEEGRVARRAGKLIDSFTNYPINWLITFVVGTRNTAKSHQSAITAIDRVHVKNMQMEDGIATMTRTTTITHRNHQSITTISTAVNTRRRGMAIGIDREDEITLIVSNFIDFF